MSADGSSNDRDDGESPPQPPKSASKKLLARFLDAIVKEFKPELDAFGAQYRSQPPVRICKACLKPADKPIFYTFEKPGLCDRCEEKISTADSIGIENWELR